MRVLSEACPEELLVHELCGNHVTNLIEVSLCALASSKILSLMWASAGLFRMGAFTLRVAGSLMRWLTTPGTLIVRFGKPPPAATAFAQLLRDYALSVHREYDKAVGHKENDRKRFKHLYAKAWEKFISVWNGEFWIRGNVIRYEEPGTSRSVHAIAQELTNAYMGAPLRSNPSCPESGKWTKTGPAVDWHIVSDVPHGTMSYVAPLAFQRLSAEAENKGSGQVDLSTIDPRELEVNQWHQMAGTRMKRFLELQSSSELQAHEVLRILLLVMQGTRVMTCWWLKASAQVQDPCAAPPLCDYVNESVAVHITALQHFHSLAAGHGRLLPLLYVPLAFKSLRQWADRRYSHAELFLAMCQSAAAWTHRRHRLRAMKMPYAAAVFADSRVDMACKRDVAAGLFSSSRCCIGRFGESLKCAAGTEENLCSSDWMAKSLHFSRFPSLQ